MSIFTRTTPQPPRTMRRRDRVKQATADFFSSFAMGLSAFSNALSCKSLTDDVDDHALVVTPMSTSTATASTKLCESRERTMSAMSTLSVEYDEDDAEIDPVVVEDTTEADEKAVESSLASSPSPSLMQAMQALPLVSVGSFEDVMPTPFSFCMPPPTLCQVIWPGSPLSRSPAHSPWMPAPKPAPTLCSMIALDDTVRMREYAYTQHKPEEYIVSGDGCGDSDEESERESERESESESGGSDYDESDDEEVEEEESEDAAEDEDEDEEEAALASDFRYWILQGSRDEEATCGPENDGEECDEEEDESDSYNSDEEEDDDDEGRSSNREGSGDPEIDSYSCGEEDRPSDHEGCDGGQDEDVSQINEEAVDEDEGGSSNPEGNEDIDRVFEGGASRELPSRIGSSDYRSTSDSDSDGDDGATRISVVGNLAGYTVSRFMLDVPVSSTTENLTSSDSNEQEARIQHQDALSQSDLERALQSLWTAIRERDDKLEEANEKIAELQEQMKLRDLAYDAHDAAMESMRVILQRVLTQSEQDAANTSA